MTSALVTHKKVFQSKRWDFDFYDPEYNEVLAQINSRGWPVKRLAEIVTNLTDGQHGYLTHLPSGIPLLRTSNVFENEINLEDVRFISLEAHESIKRSQLKPGDVLLTTVGSIGLAAVVNDSIGEANINQNLVKMTPIAEVNPYYLAIFLNSRVGRVQIERTASKSVVPIINYIRLKDIIVPLPPRHLQDRIAKLMQQAYEARNKARVNTQRLLNEIDHIVTERLGINLNNLSKEQIFLRTISQLKRWDVVYSLPYFHDLESAVLNSRFPVKSFDSIVSFSRDTVDPSRTPDEQITYIEIGDVDSTIWEVSSHNQILGKDAPSRARRLVKSGDIITGVSGVLTGTKGQSTFILPQHLDGAVVSTGFAVLRPKKGVLSGYIFALLVSNFFLEMIWRRKTGAAIPAISETDFKTLPTPLPSVEVQEEISTAVFESKEQAKRHRDKAEEAITKVKAKIDKVILGEEEIV